MDPAVSPSLSYRLAYDLMMAGKRFDMFVIPNGDHFWGDNWEYVIRYIELYFVENLLGDKAGTRIYSNRRERGISRDIPRQNGFEVRRGYGKRSYEE